MEAKVVSKPVFPNQKLPAATRPRPEIQVPANPTRSARMNPIPLPTTRPPPGRPTGLIRPSLPAATPTPSTSAATSRMTPATATTTAKPRPLTTTGTAASSSSLASRGKSSLNTFLIT